MGEAHSFTENEATAKEMLLTMAKDRREQRPRTFHGAQKAKKNRDLARGYGAGRDGALQPGRYKVSIEEIQKRTKCNLCGKVGHWKRECPLAKQNSSSGDRKEAHYMEHDEVEFFYVEPEMADEPPVLNYEPNYVGYMETASMDAISEEADFGQEPPDQAEGSRYMGVPRHPCYHLVTARWSMRHSGHWMPTNGHRHQHTQSFSSNTCSRLASRSPSKTRGTSSVRLTPSRQRIGRLGFRLALVAAEVC